MAIANPAIWRPNTQQWVIADALLAEGFSADTPNSRWKGLRAATRKRLDPSIGTGVLTFKGTLADGSYGPLDLNEQGKRCWYRIGDIMKAIAEHGWDREAGVKAAEEESTIVLPDPAPATPGFDPVAELRTFVSEVRRIRDWLNVNDPDGEIDHLSYRPIKDGRKMIEIAQIPARACLYAMTMHWERADRERAGIRPYDPATEFPGGVHAYLDALVKARVLIYLHGEAGFGKSYWAEKLAERMDLEFGQIPMCEGIGASWFLGKDLPSGYKEARWQEIFRSSGVFLLDELDRSDANALILINGPLANDVIHNPVTGDSFKRHDDCIIIGAGNSMGHGSSKYLSANELDPSTLDRFRMGRVEIGYDREVEDLIAFG